MGFSRQEYWSGLPFPPPVDHILSEVFTRTHPSWVALHSMAHSFIVLGKLVCHNKAVIHICKTKGERWGLFWVIEWLRLCSPIAGSQVQSLVTELDPFAAAKILSGQINKCFFFLKERDEIYYAYFIINIIYLNK